MNLESDAMDKTMSGRIAFLHTSEVHVKTFGELVSALAPSVHVDHLVDAQLLADAQQMGAEEPALVRRVQDAMAHAASKGAAIVVCTCSTIGGAAERTATGGAFMAARIDRAMADRAIALGPRILVVAALESTLAPTAKLINESAAALRAEAKLEHLLVPEAWPHFLRGDRTAYVEAVAAAVRAALPSADPDVVVLAQASMASAVDLLGGLPIEVLASPALGVKAALAQLHESAGRESGP